MRRTLALWFPTLSTDLLTRRLNRPARPADRAAHTIVLLTRGGGTSGGRELVARCCRLAARAGIAEGMDVAHARSLLPPALPVLIRAHQPERDAAALHRLAQWLLRVSPMVAPDGANGVLCDITGTEHLYRGEARLIRSLGRALRRLGFFVRIASAASFACARGVCRYGPGNGTIVPPEQERAAIGKLPPAALRLEAPVLDAMDELGIERVDQLLAMARPSLAMRFGHAVLERLDCAVGRGHEHLVLVRPEVPIRADLEFDGATWQHESIRSAARAVLEACVHRLLAAQRGVRRLEVTLKRPHAPGEVVTITLSRPSASLRHLWMLLASRLDRVDVEHGGGIEAIGVVAARTARLRHVQMTSSALGAPLGVGETPAPAGAAELIDTLVDRLGPDKVLRFELLDAHLPERCFQARSVLHEPALVASPRPAACPARPTHVFVPPEPASVTSMTPDGPIMQIAWGSRRSTVRTCIGPERLAPEWWRWDEPGARPARAGPSASHPPPPDRDYFATQLEDGVWLWVCRQADTGRWFVHGQWA